MSSDKNHNCQVFHFDLYGTREEKYEYLNNHSLSEVDWKELKPEAPRYFFVNKDFALQKEYEKGFSTDELIIVRTVGVATYDDKNLVSDKPYDTQYNQSYLYRPFDLKWINYDLQKVSRHRYDVMRHFVGKNNVGLICIRNNRDNNDTYFITDRLADKTVISPKTMPLFSLFTSTKKIWARKNVLLTSTKKFMKR